MNMRHGTFYEDFALSDCTGGNGESVDSYVIHHCRDECCPFTTDTIFAYSRERERLTAKHEIAGPRSSEVTNGIEQLAREIIEPIKLASGVYQMSDDSPSYTCHQSKDLQSACGMR
jgi:hypothetical protein